MKFEEFKEKVNNMKLEDFFVFIIHDNDIADLRAVFGNAPLNEKERELKKGMLGSMINLIFEAVGQGRLCAFCHRTPREGESLINQSCGRDGCPEERPPEGCGGRDD